MSEKRVSKRVSVTPDISAESRSTLRSLLNVPRKSRQRVIDPNWSGCRAQVCVIIDSVRFTLLIAAVVVANITVLVLDSDARANGVKDASYEIANNGFLCVYVCEIAVRLYVFRLQFFKVPMNLFDSLIVCIDIMALLFASALENLPSLSMLRILRMLRIVRVMRSLLMFRELYLILQGLMGALRAIMWATGLLFGVLTMWSIVAVEVLHPVVTEMIEKGFFTDCDFCESAFSSVMRGNLTFLATIIAGDSWGKLAMPIMTHHPGPGCVLIGSLLTVQLGLLNLIVAVIVDRATQAREDDDELQQTMKEETYSCHAERLLALFQEIDCDSSGHIGLEELMRGFQTNERFANELKLMDVRENELSVVFQIIDKDGDGKVSYDEFIQQLYNMKHVDSHTLLIFIRFFCEEIGGSVNDLQTRFDEFLVLAPDQDQSSAHHQYSHSPRHKRSEHASAHDAGVLAHCLAEPLGQAKLDEGFAEDSLLDKVDEGFAEDSLWKEREQTAETAATNGSNLEAVYVEALRKDPTGMLSGKVAKDNGMHSAIDTYLAARPKSRSPHRAGSSDDGETAGQHFLASLDHIDRQVQTQFEHLRMQLALQRSMILGEIKGTFREGCTELIFAQKASNTWDALRWAPADYPVHAVSRTPGN